MRRFQCAAIMTAFTFWAASAFAYPAFAAEAIKIGVGGPMTGSDSAFGAQMRNGVEQAIHDINAGGGILGRKLSVAVGDDAGDPKQGVMVAKKFVADHVPFVVGHFNSGVTLPASAIYAENGILDITPASTNPQITERGLATVFRICGRDDSQPGVAAAFVAGLDRRRIAILYDRTTYGKALADAFREAAASRRLTEVLFDGVNKEQKSYAGLVTKIEASHADVVFWGGGPNEAGLLVKQMREQGLKTAFVVSDAVASDEFSAVGGAAVDGTYMTFPLDPRDRPQAAKVVQEFKARNIDPEAYTLNSYAAVQVIGQAAAKAQSSDPATIAKLIHSGLRFSTVLGDISFDAKGDVTRPDYVIFIWKRGLDGKQGYYPLKP
jgi:branched-chain amino acid transport system substrate-binding protein